MIETITPGELLAYLSAALLIGAIAIFYFTIIKPHQDEKNERKTRTGPQDSRYDLADKSGDNGPDGPNYDQIIDEFPTYNRQVK